MDMSMRVISWEEFIIHDPRSPISDPLAITIGVFDGVHRGHQALIQRICSVPSPDLRPPPPIAHCSLLTAHSPSSTSPFSLLSSLSLLPTVVTFRQNPQKILKSANGAPTAEITTLDQKLHILEDLGVQLAVLIDFSEEFSKISGRGFIDLLLGCRPVQLIALGKNFRCGHRLDTGVEEIRSLAGARGVEVWVMPPVLDEGQPVSSSRIRQALAAGRQAEAERLLGRPIRPHP